MVGDEVPEYGDENTAWLRAPRPPRFDLPVFDKFPPDEETDDADR